ncbi:hypothetical protein BHE74_00051042 [Ensete ventricosum]|nr:hypothetical protein BHE74_00051042 [Ensete ventricosum]
MSLSVDLLLGAITPWHIKLTHGPRWRKDQNVIVTPRSLSGRGTSTRTTMMP